jgi:hypothetical protein
MSSKHSDPSPGYETRDVNVAKMTAIVVLPAFLIVGLLVLLGQYFHLVQEDLYFEKVLKPDAADHLEIRAHEKEILTTYGVVDAKAGRYRIPVERAMELLLNEAVRRQ